jgi:hypothetical protein
MASKKKSSGKKSSSGSNPKSKRIVKGKMAKTMHEFKHHELSSGRSGKKVKNPKQAIAIGLSEARLSGADIPPSPNSRRNRQARRSPRRRRAQKRVHPEKNSPQNSETSHGQIRGQGLRPA